MHSRLMQIKYNKAKSHILDKKIQDLPLLKKSSRSNFSVKLFVLQNMGL